MLDEFGKIAVAEIVFYVPVLCIAAFTVSRHGFNKREGWIYLLTFAIVRIVGAVLSILSRTESNPSAGIFIAADILQASGLSPLLLSTTGFVNIIVLHVLPFPTQVLRLIRLALVAGLVLAIIAGTQLGPDNSASAQAKGHTLSKAASLCFVGGYAGLLCVEAILWGKRDVLSPSYRKLLTSLLCALPFLAVRTLYTVLGAFTPSPSQWSPTVGNWRLYLTMGLLMEYIIVCIYVITGATSRFDDKEGERAYNKWAVPNVSHDGSLEMDIQRRGLLRRSDGWAVA